MSYFSIYNSYSKSKLPFSKIYDNKYKQMNPKIKTIITSNLSYKQIYNCSNNPSLFFGFLFSILSLNIEKSEIVSFDDVKSFFLDNNK